MLTGLCGWQVKNKKLCAFTTTGLQIFSLFSFLIGSLRILAVYFDDIHSFSILPDPCFPSLPHRFPEDDGDRPSIDYYLFKSQKWLPTYRCSLMNLNISLIWHCVTSGLLRQSQVCTTLSLFLCTLLFLSLPLPSPSVLLRSFISVFMSDIHTWFCVLIQNLGTMCERRHNICMC